MTRRAEELAPRTWASILEDHRIVPADLHAQTPPPADVPERLGRYRVTGELGRGGMGQVLTAHDPEIGREVAIKIALDAGQVPRALLERFMAEARLTGQLEHPNIVPVYDVGATERGLVYFVMKRLRGRPLGEVLRDERSRDGRHTPRLLHAFVAVCEAVAFAHHAGVVHQDLKPDNIMLGEFGEVLVVDWGLAALCSAARRAAPTLQAPALDRDLISGSPGFIAPERLRPPLPPPDPRADQWSLGAVLYAVLSGAPPYSSHDPRAAIHDTLAGPPEDVRLRDPDRDVPDEIAEICHRALSGEPADRFEHTGALAEAVRGFLDGRERRARALGMVAQADELLPQIQEQRARAAGIREDAEARLAGLKGTDTVEAKVAGWALADEAAALEQAANLDALRWEQVLRGALNLAPELHEAHTRLASRYRAELEEAERRRETEAAARAEWLLRQHDRGHHRAFLAGTATLTLVTEPPGAAVFLAPFVERDRRLVPGPERALGPTPLVDLPLPPGSYRCRIVAPGRAELSYPVLLPRAGAWHGVRPGQTAPHPVLLPLADALGPLDRVVPAGWCVIGGDPAAPDPLSRRRVWVDAFVMRAYPVTNRELLAFLNGLLRSGEEAEAERCQPRLLARPSHPLDGDPLLTRGADGRFLPPRDPPPDWADRPAAWLDLFSCQQLAAATPGGPWRLPDELEREKAARGVDGRFFPWGDRFDPAFANMVSSRSVPGPASVYAFPLDESVYGVRGLAGNVRDRCGNPWTEDGPAADGEALTLRFADAATDFVSARGGSSSNTALHCRAAGRFGDPPSVRVLHTGLRLVRSLA